MYDLPHSLFNCSPEKPTDAFALQKDWIKFVAKRRDFNNQEVTIDIVTSSIRMNRGNEQKIKSLMSSDCLYADC